MAMKTLQQMKTLQMKALQVNLGIPAPLALAPGWYWDAYTGQTVYSDGQQFYALQNGLFVPLQVSYWNAYTLTPVTIIAGVNGLKVTISFNYIGPAVTGVTCRYSVFTGGNGLLPTEQVGEVETFNIPANLTATAVAVTNSHTFSVADLTPAGSNWTDIYVYLSGGSPSIISQAFGYYGALKVVAEIPTISSFTIQNIAAV